MRRVIVLVAFVLLAGCAQPLPTSNETARSAAPIEEKAPPLLNDRAGQRAGPAAALSERLLDETGHQPEPASWPVRFDSVRHDFGTITDVAGVQRHAFTYENVSGRPLILHVPCERPSCLPEKRRVEPGESGTVRALLNPKRRNGRLTRQITIFWHWADEPLVAD